MPSWLLFVLIGTLGGVASGLFGVGGGIVIVPALIYWAGFSQHMATGTSLAVLLPPIGLAAVFEYYRHGNVDVRGGGYSGRHDVCRRMVWRLSRQPHIRPPSAPDVRYFHLLPWRLFDLRRLEAIGLAISNLTG